MALTKLNFGGNQQALVASDIPTLTTNKMPTGSVLQVKNVDSHAQQNFNVTTWQLATGLTIDLTCSSTSNKVLILCNLQGYKNNVTDGSGMFTGVYADSTRILTNFGYYMRGSADTGSYGTVSNSFLYSPNSTSQITYAVYCRSGDGNNFILNPTNSGGTPNSNDSTTSSFTIMEIAG